MTIPNGKVREIFTSPDKGLPMVSHPIILALAGIGLEGDRYALGKGRFQSLRSRQKIRHITFIALEAILETNSKLSINFETSETRRNIVTQDIDLNTLIDREFRIGDALFKGTELCEPCPVPGSLTNKPGFKNAFNNRGGLRAEILESGLITINSLIVVRELC